MARTLVSCGAMLVLFLALAAASIPFMTAVEDPAARYIVGPLGALLATIGLLTWWGLLMGHGRGTRSLSAMLEAARRGQMPEDGEPMIATGRIRALTSPLTAPLSGTACVGYQYRMYYTTRDAEGEALPVPVYWGSAARPFALHSPAALVRVLAVPLMTLAPEVHATAEAQERARAWIRHTRFEVTKANPLGGVRTAFAMIHEAFTDEDGEARHDWRREGEDRDPATLVLEESVLPVDALASVYGTWSRDRAAVVAGSGASGAAAVSLALGPPEKLPAQAGLHSLRAYLVSAVLWPALAAGIWWLGARGLAGF